MLARLDIFEKNHPFVDNPISVLAWLVRKPSQCVFNHRARVIAQTRVTLISWWATTFCDAYPGPGNKCARCSVAFDFPTMCVFKCLLKMFQIQCSVSQNLVVVIIGEIVFDCTHLVK